MSKYSKYRHFLAEDFMRDESFQDWILHENEDNDHFWKQFIQENPEKAAAVFEAKKMLQYIEFSEHRPTPERVESALHAAWSHIQAQNSVPFPNTKKQKKHVFYKIWWAASAAVFIAFSIGAWWVWINHIHNKPQLATQITPTADVPAPANNRAVITLANGEKIYLTDDENGKLATQGSTDIQKMSDGSIVYSGRIDESAPVMYNTLSNPLGSTVIYIALSDGSKVWLNAGSSLRYPVRFVGNERKVSIDGEAYFEVAHHASMPFIVNKNKMDVTVLGTHFNVKAYNDETVTKVTLLEGLVKAALSGEQSLMLKPGEQAQITQHMKLVKNVDIDEVMSWKNGVFRFKEANLKDIMQQVARWYDVQIEYAGDVAKINLGGTLSRQASLSELLKILEEAEMVKFKVTGKTVRVIP